VPQPYTCPSSVSANDALSDAATWTNLTPEGKDLPGIAVGVLSLGFKPESSSSSSSSSSELSESTSASFVGATHYILESEVLDQLFRCS
jgi:hypothetical protein